jgi:hypothetical protein
MVDEVEMDDSAETLEGGLLGTSFDSSVPVLNSILAELMLASKKAYYSSIICNLRMSSVFCMLRSSTNLAEWLLASMAAALDSFLVYVK